MQHIISLMKAFGKCYLQDEKTKLLKWTNENTLGEKEVKLNQDGYLNVEIYGLLIYKVLKDAPFFNRFNQETILKYLGGA